MQLVVRIGGCAMPECRSTWPRLSHTAPVDQDAMSHFSTSLDAKRHTLALSTTREALYPTKRCATSNLEFDLHLIAFLCRLARSEHRAITPGRIGTWQKVLCCLDASPRADRVVRRVSKGTPWRPDAQLRRLPQPDPTPEQRRKTTASDEFERAGKSLEIDLRGQGMRGRPSSS
jgi:hypothetical protein